MVSILILGFFILDSKIMAESDKTNSNKFIPNVHQLRQAIEQLPDPEEWPESTYTSAVSANGHDRPVQFIKRRVNRGGKQPYRWIYESKVLIRKRDTFEDY